MILCVHVCVIAVSGPFSDLEPYGYGTKLSLHFKGHFCRTPAGQSINHTHSCIFTFLFLILSWSLVGCHFHISDSTYFNEFSQYMLYCTVCDLAKWTNQFRCCNMSLLF